MYLLSASVDVDEKNATSFLKARNSKIMCRTDTTIVAAVITSSYHTIVFSDSISKTSAKHSSVGKGCAGNHMSRACCSEQLPYVPVSR